jgi:glycosyltransferase involved in cell wall biosynthesis
VKQRLAVCIGAFEYGGQGTVVETELKALRDRYSITLFAERIERLVPAGVDAVEISTWVPFPRLSKQVIAALEGYDLIHCHDSLGFMVAAHRCGRPWIVTSHGIAPPHLRSSIRSGVEGIVTMMAYPRLYGAATETVAISEYVATWLKRVTRRQPILIRNGAPQPAASQRKGPPSNALLYVGEVTRRKGIGFLLKGLATCPTDITLDIVGRGELARYRALAAQRGVAQRVQFHGSVEAKTLDGLYRSCLATCSSSPWEGFGLPIIEGFAAGAPTVVRDNTGLRELALRSGAGTVFQTPPALAEGVAEVKLRWRQMHSAALRYAEANSWAQAMSRYDALFTSVLAATSSDVC